MSTRAPTTAPLVVRTIFDNLKDSVGLIGVQVLYGISGQLEREHVLISGDVEWEDEEWAALGNRAREEKYAVEGYVLVSKPGDDQQESVDRAYELLAVVELELRSMADNPGMGFSPALNTAFGAGEAQVTNLGMRPKKGHAGSTDQGKAYLIEFELRVVARI